MFSVLDTLLQRFLETFREKATAFLTTEEGILKKLPLTSEKKTIFSFNTFISDFLF